MAFEGGVKTSRWAKKLGALGLGAADTRGMSERRSVESFMVAKAWGVGEDLHFFVV